MTPCRRRRYYLVAAGVLAAVAVAIRLWRRRHRNLPAAERQDEE